MSRFFQTLILAWAAASLLASPVLAGVRCLECCGVSHAGVGGDRIAVAIGFSVPNGCCQTVPPQAGCATGSSPRQEDGSTPTSGMSIAIGMIDGCAIGSHIASGSQTDCAACPECGKADSRPMIPAIDFFRTWSPALWHHISSVGLRPVPVVDFSPGHVVSHRGLIPQPSAQVLLCSWLK